MADIGSVEVRVRPVLDPDALEGMVAELQAAIIRAVQAGFAVAFGDEDDHTGSTPRYFGEPRTPEEG